MTTNESFFFRDKTPFELFRETMMPALLSARATHRRIRIWCAAASTGQEPYTLAMILKDMELRLKGWTVEILATDLSSFVNDTATTGIYTERYTLALHDALPISAELRRRPRAPGAQTAGRIARALSIRGEQSLRHYLPLHDTGSWSIYMLYRPGFAWRAYLADRTYHCYHVTLLRQLAKDAPAGRRTYVRYARRWARDARRVGLTCR
jgi:hypothetical protein